MTVKFGLSSYDDYEFNNRPKNNNKDLWLRLQTGANPLRIVTDPFLYMVHKYKEEGDKGFGDKINCSKYHGKCPLCEMGLKASPRWYVGVIDRRTNTYKILDMSSAIYKDLQIYARKEAWGNPMSYEIDINVDPNAGPTGYYRVVPDEKRPLSDSDVFIKQAVNLDELKRRCTPPTPEEVNERLARIRAKKNGGKPVEAAVQNNQVAVPVDENEEFSFKQVTV